ncbi:MAG: hypothetical protein GVY26_01210 [Bacteroidetes bacterium]|nr:hypothetical protein [Bacteroidota bacterium]
MVLYKVGQDGAIQVEQPVENCCAYNYHGDLFSSDGRYFFDGVGISTMAPGQRILLEFNEDLDIILRQEWPDLAPENTSFILSTISSGINSFTRGARRVSGDTLYAIVPYAEGPVAIPETRYEILGLDGQVHLVRDMKDIDSLFSRTYFTMSDEAFYIFGGMDGAPLPGADNFGNEGLIGKYRLSDGQIEGVSWFTDPFLGQATFGSMGQYHEGNMYCSAYTDSPLSEAPYAASGCQEAGTTVIEVRDENLQFIRGVNLPCKYKTNGGKAFAFSEDGHIFYANTNIESGATSVFKFDSLLNTVWVQDYAIPFPYSILLDAEDNLVVNTIDNFYANPTLRIYRINTEDGGIVNSTDLPLPAAAPAFHPNPFTDELRLPNPPGQPMSVEVIGINGQPHGRYEAQNGALQLGHLPAGIYLLRMSDAKSGALLGVQRVVKAGG